MQLKLDSYCIFFKFVAKTDITQTPYYGQVWLKDNDNDQDDLNSLLLYLNTGGTAEWGHVCLPKQLDAGNRTMVADTVCRQLGYTNSQKIIDDTEYVTFIFKLAM